MDATFKRTQPSCGAVFFRGRSAHRPEDYDFLRSLGIEIARGARREDGLWTLELSHPRWSSATLIAFREPALPDQSEIRYSSGLREREQGELAGAGWSIGVSCPATKGNVLLDRKNFLRYLRAVMGNNGIAGVDDGSRRFWTRDALDDELQHDAELDIVSLCTFHAVTDDPDGEGPIAWLHSHGLAELDACDFDILNAHRSLNTGSGSHVLRSLAFLMLDGTLAPGSEFPVLRPGTPVRAIDAEEFQRRAAPPHAALRQHAGDHRARRVVLCDPAPSRWDRLLGRGRPCPARTLCESIEEKIYLTKPWVTELSARRAHATLGLFHQYLAEFEDRGPLGLVKVSCRTPRGESESPWFRFVAFHGDAIQGVLDNNPVELPDMRRGEQYTLPVSGVRDWLVLTPAGEISPRDMSVAHLLRAHPDLFRPRD